MKGCKGFGSRGDSRRGRAGETGTEKKPGTSTRVGNFIAHEKKGGKGKTELVRLPLAGWTAACCDRGREFTGALSELEGLYRVGLDEGTVLAEGFGASVRGDWMRECF